VYVDDVDDNGPLFKMRVFWVSVPENLAVGSHVVTAQANDPDTTSVLHYSMIGNISGEHVSINNKTGKNCFDFNRKLGIISLSRGVEYL
jgi:hypothetical protein